MARERPSRDNGNAATDTASEGRKKNVVGVMAGAQDAIRTGAGKAAERLPEAMAGAEVAARETQKVLGEMPNQALIIGTSFSLGLGVGLFMTGSNRLLVLAALAPAAAMAATLLGREGQADAQGTAGLSIE
ncbi:MAG TPA: hypothetical protein VMP67_08245 [Candidatus Limnocylindria bacterium]|nr:hypothetical protein [Candidatus Limnocylindria bacterium]